MRKTDLSVCVVRWVRTLFMTAGLLMLTSYGARCEQGRVDLCGVGLRPSVSTILSGIDDAFGKAVVCRTAPLKGQWAAVKVQDDGTPLITLDPERGKSEDEILHELLHLQILADLKVRGIRGLPPPGVNERLFAEIVYNLSELMDHSVIYPRMRSMGFDPDKKEREMWEGFLRRNKPPKWGNFPPIVRATRYAAITVGFTEPELLNGLDRMLKDAGWGDDVILAGKLRKSVLEASITTRVGRPKEIFTCLNLLFANAFDMRYKYADDLLYLQFRQSPGIQPK